MKKNQLIFLAVGLVLFFAIGNVMAADSTQRMSNVDDSTEAGYFMSRNSEKLGNDFDNTARTLSFTGDKAVFQSRSNLSDWDENPVYDIYMRDTLTGTTTLVSAQTDGYATASPWRDSVNPAISQYGRYVAFQSKARLLVEGDDGYPSWIFNWQVYRRDLQTNTTQRVSVAEYGYGGNDDSANPSISADGRYVAFQSYAYDLVPDFETDSNQHIYRTDMSTNPPTIQAVSVDPDGYGGNRNSYNPSLSHNGQFVAFSSFADNLSEQDTNGYRDVFIRNMATGTTTLVSVDYRYGYAGNDRSGNPSTSGNGRFVAFESEAGDLVVPVSGDPNFEPGCCPPGMYSDSRQIYVRDTAGGVTQLVSVGFYGYAGEDNSDNPSISSDGRYVAFESYADNLVENDTNEMKDIFVYDRQAGVMTRVNVDSEMNPTPYDEWDSNRPSISPDGRYVSFDTAFDLIGDIEETDAPWIRQVYRNNYSDQDGDGVKDGQEIPGVTNTATNVTAKSFTGTGTVNVKSSAGTTITFVESVDPAAKLQDTRSADGSPAPTSVPCGLVNFTLNVAAPGDEATVEITFPCAVEGFAYYKYGPEGWITFSNNKLYPGGVVSLSGNTAILKLKDGGAGDLDGIANGVIVDPSGPGSTPYAGGGDSGGGCFIGTLAN